MSTTPEAAPPPPPPAPAAPATQDNTIAILSYLTPFGFIVALIMFGSKKTPLGSFHLRQTLGFFITGIALWPVNIILAFIPFLGWACMVAIFFSMVVLWFIGFIGALNGQMKVMPVVGPLYQKWFAGAFT